MIHLPVHRIKGCPLLGAPAPGLPGPFGTWNWEPDDDEAPYALADTDRPVPPDGPEQA